MCSVSYKGYLIVPAPYQLTGSGGWTTRIYISRHTGPDVIEQNFSAGNTFKTRQEAIPHCIEFGRQIIDGGFDNIDLGGLEHG